MNSFKLFTFLAFKKLDFEWFIAPKIVWFVFLNPTPVSHTILVTPAAHTITFSLLPPTATPTLYWYDMLHLPPYCYIQLIMNRHIMFPLLLAETHIAHFSMYNLISVIFIWPWICSLHDWFSATKYNICFGRNCYGYFHEKTTSHTCHCSFKTSNCT